jgi:NAD(P)-dependent dehydrogenase (short-subunit alcohol dehydrogenase family)
VNVKGTFLVSRAFLALAGRERRVTVVSVSSMMALRVIPGASAYSLSKLLVAHLAQFVAAEYPVATAVAVHPGILLTDMLSHPDEPFRRFANDPPQLVGSLAVWCTTDAARFLSGRYIDAHWSVDELVARRDEIVREGKLLTGFNVKLGRDNI